MPEKLLNIRMDDEDRALLDACSTKEKLTKSDILRRALRAYARTLGVGADVTKPRRAKPKRK